MYDIDPPIDEIITYNKMDINVASIVLNEYAVFRVALYMDAVFITMKVMRMEGDDYKNWTSDDYVNTWVLEQLRKT